MLPIEIDWLRVFGWLSGNRPAGTAADALDDLARGTLPSSSVAAVAGTSSLLQTVAPSGINTPYTPYLTATTTSAATTSTTTTTANAATVTSGAAVIDATTSTGTTAIATIPATATGAGAAGGTAIIQGVKHHHVSQNHSFATVETFTGTCADNSPQATSSSRPRGDQPRGPEFVTISSEGSTANKPSGSKLDAGTANEDETGSGHKSSSSSRDTFEWGHNNAGANYGKVSDDSACGPFLGSATSSDGPGHGGSGPYQDGTAYGAGYGGFGAAFNWSIGASSGGAAMGYGSKTTESVASPMWRKDRSLDLESMAWGRRSGGRSGGLDDRIIRKAVYTRLSTDIDG